VPSIIVREVNVPEEGTWHFEESHLMWRDKTGRGSHFDPFPAYPHDIEIARNWAKHVSEMLPPLYDVNLYVTNREVVARTNGHSNAYEGGHYDEDDEWVRDSPSGVIVLSGKRIPPHPAMTRYLVGHEYGHNVEWMINHLRGEKTIHASGLINEYAEMRGFDSTHNGTGGRWHDSIHEVFACDFRILVCGVEPNFWPHPGIEKPTLLPHVVSWWDNIREGWPK
jgi:hypothetical protein